jgi:hypothetical protein
MITAVGVSGTGSVRDRNSRAGLDRLTSRFADQRETEERRADRAPAAHGAGRQHPAVSASRHGVLARKSLAVYDVLRAQPTLEAVEDPVQEQSLAVLKQ